MLRGSKYTATVIKKDLKSQLIYLLPNQMIIAAKNLLYTKDSLFDPPPKPDDSHSGNYVYDDINTSDVYRAAYDKLVTDQSLHIPLGIIFFINSTHTDFHGQLCLELLTFTLSIFNRAA